MGTFYYTQDREPTAIDKFKKGESDSTLGDRAKSVNTYREIVVYNEDQAVLPGELLALVNKLCRTRASFVRRDCVASWFVH